MTLRLPLYLLSFGPRSNHRWRRIRNRALGTYARLLWEQITILW